MRIKQIKYKDYGNGSTRKSERQVVYYKGKKAQLKISSCIEEVEDKQEVYGDLKPLLPHKDNPRRRIRDDRDKKIIEEKYFTGNEIPQKLREKIEKRFEQKF